MKHFKKKDLLVRWDKNQVPTSELSTRGTRLQSSTVLSLPNMKLRLCVLRKNPTKLRMGSSLTSGKRDPLFPNFYGSWPRLVIAALKDY